MTRVLIVAHGGLAKEFSQVAASILNLSEIPVDCIGADWTETRADLSKKLSGYFSGQPDDVLILADLFGSTHVNLCLPFLRPDHVEMITGFNLALLVKAVTLLDSVPLSELAGKLSAYGQNHLYAVLERQPE